MIKISLSCFEEEKKKTKTGICGKKVRLQRLLPERDNAIEKCRKKGIRFQFAAFLKIYTVNLDMCVL